MVSNFFVEKVQIDDYEIEIIRMRPIFLRQKEDDNNEYNLQDLLQISGEETINWDKIICLQVAENDIMQFDKLYREYLPSEVWDLYSMKLAMAEISNQKLKNKEYG